MQDDAPTFAARAAACFCYLSGLLGLWVVGPLVVWLVQRGRSAFVARHAWLSLCLQLFLGVGSIVVGVVLWLLFTFVWTKAPDGNLGLGRLPDLLIASVVGFGPVVLFYVVASLVGAIRGLLGADAGWPRSRGAEHGR